MVMRRYYAAIPLVTRQAEQLFVAADSFCRDANIRLAAGHLVCDLRRVALVDVKLHLRILLHKSFNCRRQAVAGLGVGSSYSECACILMAEFLANTLDIFHIAHHPLG